MTVNVIARVADRAGDNHPATTWREGLSSTAAGVKQQWLRQDKDMGGDLLSFGLSGAAFYYLHSFPQTLLRESPCPKRFAPMAMFNMSGKISITQNKRSVELRPGQFAFFDSANRLEMNFHDEFEHLYVRLPASGFSKAEFYEAILTPAEMSNDFNGVFFELIDKVWKCADKIKPVEHGALLNSILSLSMLTTPFRALNDKVGPCIRMKRAMAFIEENLAESWLTPERVADAQGVSRRYLDERFGRLNLRVERCIWERRLIRAHQDLVLSSRNKRQSRSIIQIALDAGFTSPSHFSRSFKARFGLPPRELKAQIEQEAKVGLPH